MCEESFFKGEINSVISEAFLFICSSQNKKWEKSPLMKWEGEGIFEEWVN